MKGIFAFIAFIASLLVRMSVGNSKECEVCVHTIEKFRTQLKEVKPISSYSAEEIQDKIKEYCDPLPMTSKEGKLCSELGAKKNSLSSVLGHLTPRILEQYPALSMCKMVSMTAPDVCRLSFGNTRKVYKDAEDFKNLKVKDLKGIARELLIDVEGVTERSEFEKRIIAFYNTEKAAENPQENANEL